MTILPRRISKERKRDGRCSQCGIHLVRNPTEGPSHFARRRFCDKKCAVAFRNPYASRHERLLQNSACAEVVGGCWEWTGYRDRKGYGRMQDNALGEVLAHRISYIEHHGPIPDGLHVLHSCDNPPCINPDHLRVGTNDDNMRDRAERNRHARLFGERNPRAKLTESDVLAIRLSSLPQKELAARYAVSQSNISVIKRRESWGSVA